jgi:hypothetical protein
VYSTRITAAITTIARGINGSIILGGTDELGHDNQCVGCDFRSVSGDCFSCVLCRNDYGGVQLIYSDYYENDWSKHMRSMLGKQVKVTIAWEEIDDNGALHEATSITGQLLMFDEGGEVAIRPEGDFIHWCWPNLKTELVE